MVKADGSKYLYDLFQNHSEGRKRDLKVVKLVLR